MVNVYLLEPFTQIPSLCWFLVCRFVVFVFGDFSALHKLNNKEAVTVLVCLLLGSLLAQEGKLLSLNLGLFISALLLAFGSDNCGSCRVSQWSSVGEIVVINVMGTSNA